MSPSSAKACRLVRAKTNFDGRQGLTYAEGITAQSVGATGLSMHLVTIPPGARAKAHLHESHETAIFVTAGTARTWYGERLEHHVDMGAGDMLYIPAGLPHLPVNIGGESCTAVIARTDANEQEAVRLLPELDALVP
jgi:uncharacterized RmlC-like cupin family protein